VIDGKTYWRSSSTLPEKRAARVAHLLPAFDEYLISYKDRSAAVETNNNKEMPRGNMIFSSAIVIGGRVVGGWKRSLEGESVRITLRPFAPLSKTERQLVADAADRYGAFLGLAVVFN
jgi:hypothetical protein